MKINVTREAAQALIDKLGDGEQPGELHDLRDHLAKRLDQTQAVQKLTAAELSALLAVIRQTRTPNMLIGSQLETAAPKLRVMLDAYMKNGGGQEGEDDDRD